MKVDVYTLEAKKSGTLDLDKEIFGLEPRKDILHRMVVYQQAKRRAGTHKSKRRSEIAGSTKKIVRQKGSGGARHGNKKAPIFRGGGKAFGPLPRDHAIKLPKKVRALALRHALSSKMADGNLVVLEAETLAEPKTSALAKSLGKLGWDRPLVIGGKELDENFVRAASNLPRFNVLPSQGANVEDILRCGQLVLTKAAVSDLQERFQ